MTAKINKKYIEIFRRIIQIIFFIWLPALFSQIFQSAKTIFVYALHGQGTFVSIVPSIIFFVIVTIVTVIFGRFFCGWMCAFGSMGDFLYRVPRMIISRKPVKGKKPAKPALRKLDAVFKYFKYVFLAFIVIFMWILQIVSIPQGANPWDLFGMLVSFKDLPSISEITGTWLPATIILLIIMVGDVLIERFFCRYICPLGAYFGIISKLRLTDISKKRDNCGSCSMCSRSCSMGIELGGVDRVRSAECINCMECSQNCPNKNVHPAVNNVYLNTAVISTTSVALITGSYYLGNFAGNKLTGSESALAATSNGVNNGVAADLEDGTYQGTGTGYRGETSVSVTVANGAITGITIDSTNDDEEYFNRASKTIISEIVAAQSTDVDTVSGATYSSNGIISAVADAIGNSSSTDTTQSAESTAEPSATTSSDSGKGIVPDDSSNSSDSSSDASSNSSDSSSDSTSSSDTTVSGANVKDGTYTGSGTGFRGETDVTVTVKNGKVTAISIDSYQDDEQYFSSASSTIINEIIADQDVNVDTVSGATYSSNGIISAVADALDIDFTPSTPEGGSHGHDGGFGGHGNFQ